MQSTGERFFEELLSEQEYRQYTMRHGYWRYSETNGYRCSECGTGTSGVVPARWRYCPFCGSKMENP